MPLNTGRETVPTAECSWRKRRWLRRGTVGIVAGILSIPLIIGGMGLARSPVNAPENTSRHERRIPVITPELIEQIARHEGLRLRPYLDSVGVWTVGYGHNMNEPITESDAKQILVSDIQKAINGCVHAYPWFMELSQPRQYAMIDLAFNLGIGGLNGFKKFLSAMELGNYYDAAYQLEKSRWAEQVKGRAVDIQQMIRGSEKV